MKILITLATFLIATTALSQTSSAYEKSEVSTFFEHTIYENYLDKIHLPELLFKHKEFKKALKKLDFHSILYIRYNGILHYGYRKIPNIRYNILVFDCDDGNVFHIAYKLK